MVERANAMLDGLAIAKSNAREAPPDVAAYKLILKRVLDNRPSGMRHRLAKTLGKNRSFISQMANPAYATPAPARHLETIFELCRFSKAERTDFLAAYVRAHPRRSQLARSAPRTRKMTLLLPDLHDVVRNAIVDRMVADLVRQIELLTERDAPPARRSARYRE
jgi:hypothetical protein